MGLEGNQSQRDLDCSADCTLAFGMPNLPGKQDSFKASLARIREPRRIRKKRSFQNRMAW
jgi:hypothetical protein